jgi:hypothetical protein
MKIKLLVLQRVNLSLNMHNWIGIVVLVLSSKYPTSPIDSTIVQQCTEGFDTGTPIKGAKCVCEKKPKTVFLMLPLPT